MCCCIMVMQRHITVSCFFLFSSGRALLGKGQP